MKEMVAFEPKLETEVASEKRTRFLYSSLPEESKNAMGPITTYAQLLFRLEETHLQCQDRALNVYLFKMKEELGLRQAVICRNHGCYIYWFPRGVALLAREHFLDNQAPEAEEIKRVIGYEEELLQTTNSLIAAQKKYRTSNQ